MPPAAWEAHLGDLVFDNGAAWFVNCGSTNEQRDALGRAQLRSVPVLGWRPGIGARDEDIARAVIGLRRQDPLVAGVHTVEAVIESNGVLSRATSTFEVRAR